MASKLALVIGNTQYEDARLAALTSPGADVKALSEVLREPAIGSFTVETLLDNPEATVRKAIAMFFASDRERDDLLLMYFSGHGVLDERGELFLAVKDSDSRYLNGTAVPASFISDAMDRCPSRRLVLILDCCHSGAFGRGAKGAPGSSIGIGTVFEGNGSARAVLTATNSTQYAWEGSQVTGNAQSSVFTKYLVAGLQTGAADSDGDGAITVDELYDYVHDHVVDETPKQEPNKFVYQQQGRLVLASAPARAAELYPELVDAIHSPYPRVREEAVGELARVCRDGPARLAPLALAALQELSNDDSRRVSTAAQAALDKAKVQASPDPQPLPPDPGPDAGGGDSDARSKPPWPLAWFEAHRALAMVGAIVVVGLVIGAVAIAKDLGPQPSPTPAPTARATPTPPPPKVVSVVVPSTQSWTDTAVDVTAGEGLTIHADGLIHHSQNSPAVGPDGDPDPSLKQFDVIPSAGHAALIGRIGPQGTPFLVGKDYSQTVAATGRLYLGVNDMGVDNNSGSFTAQVQVKFQP